MNLKREIILVVNLSKHTKAVQIKFHCLTKLFRVKNNTVMKIEFTYHGFSRDVSGSP